MAFRRFFAELLNFLKKHTPLVKLNVIMQTIAIPSVSSELFEAFAPDSASDSGFCDVISCVAESVLEVTYVDDKAAEVTPSDDSVVEVTPSDDSVVEVTPANDSVVEVTPVNDSIVGKTSRNVVHDYIK